MDQYLFVCKTLLRPFGKAGIFGADVNKVEKKVGGEKDWEPFYCQIAYLHWQALIQCFSRTMFLKEKGLGAILLLPCQFAHICAQKSYHYAVLYVRSLRLQRTGPSGLDKDKIRNKKRASWKDNAQDGFQPEDFFFLPSSPCCFGNGHGLFILMPFIANQIRCWGDLISDIKKSTLRN